MGKYTPLTKFLKQLSEDSITLTFTQIERIIAPDTLPYNARRKRNSGLYNLRWWDNSPGALESDARLDAGFQIVMVDFESERVRFLRIRGV